MCTEMPSTAHAQWWLSTPLAREYVCQWCGKALPPLGIEPLPPAPKARALKGRAIWTLVLSHRYRREVHIHLSAANTVIGQHVIISKEFGSIWPFGATNQVGPSGKSKGQHFSRVVNDHIKSFLMQVSFLSL